MKKIVFDEQKDALFGLEYELIINSPFLSDERHQKLMDSNYLCGRKLTSIWLNQSLAQAS